MESETNRIMPLEAKRLAIQARATDVPWLVSFLLHCRDRADTERSLAALRRNCPEQFKQPRAVRVMGRGEAPPAPRVLRSRDRGKESKRRGDGR